MEKDTSSLAATREKHYSDILRIALAMAIIRRKPQHMMAKVYAQVIASQLTENEKTWKSKAQALEEELLLIKEELLQVKFSMSKLPERTTEETTSNTESSGTSSLLDSNGMDCLTPPCSTESTSSKQHPTETKNQHTEFLKSIIALREAPQVARMLANSDMRLTVTSTVLQAISVLRHSINDKNFVETSIPECCVDGLLGVLDMEMPSTGSSEVIDKALEYAEEMMQAVMNCEPCGNNVLQEKYSRLIVRLACHQKTTELVLTKLIAVLKSFSMNLRAISREPMILANNLGKYNSMYYILWCIESVLSQKLEYGLEDSVSNSLMESLEDSVLHLSKTFPLFTHYVWRIGGLLAKTVKCTKQEPDNLLARSNSNTEQKY